MAVDCIFLHPNLDAKVRQSQCRQKDTHDFHAQERFLQGGDRVLVKNFSAGELWLPGCIVSKTGSVSFTIKLMMGEY